MRFFEWSGIVEWVIIFASFSWLWGFLLEKMKIKKSSDDFHWNVWTNTKTLFVRNNIFKKRIPNLRFWIIYILVEISLLGTTLGRFSQLFFYFSSSANHGGQNFYSVPPPSPPPWKSFLRPCNMFIVLSFVHNLFQFGTMINRWLKLALQLLLRNKYVAFCVFRTLWLVFHTLLTNTCSKFKVQSRNTILIHWLWSKSTIKTPKRCHIVFSFNFV